MDALNVIYQLGGKVLLAFVLAFFVESFVEYLFGRPFNWPLFAKIKEYKSDVLIYLAAIVGIVLAFYYAIDLFYLALYFLEVPDVALTNMGIVLSGLAIGRGANFVHQLMSKWFPAK